MHSAHQAYGSGNVNMNHSSNTGGCLGSSNCSKFSRFVEWESDRSVTVESHNQTNSLNTLHTAEAEHSASDAESCSETTFLWTHHMLTCFLL